MNVGENTWILTLQKNSGDLCAEQHWFSCFWCVNFLGFWLFFCKIDKKLVNSWAHRGKKWNETKFSEAHMVPFCSLELFLALKQSTIPSWLITAEPFSWFLSPLLSIWACSLLSCSSPLIAVGMWESNWNWEQDISSEVKAESGNSRSCSECLGWSCPQRKWQMRKGFGGDELANGGYYILKIHSWSCKVNLEQLYMELCCSLPTTYTAA